MPLATRKGSKGTLHEDDEGGQARSPHAPNTSSLPRTRDQLPSTRRPQSRSSKSEDQISLYSAILARSATAPALLYFLRPCSRGHWPLATGYWQAGYWSAGQILKMRDRASDAAHGCANGAGRMDAPERPIPYPLSAIRYPLLSLLVFALRRALEAASADGFDERSGQDETDAG